MLIAALMLDAPPQRLNARDRGNIGESEILGTVEPLVGRYAGERDPGEGFGDFLVWFDRWFLKRAEPVQVDYEVDA